MSETFANRYLLKQSWSNTGIGWLARATDTKLKREVLLYRIRYEDDVRKQEALRWLGKAARFSDKRYLHLLDAVSEEGGLYAVLTCENGSLLSERLRSLDWNGREIMEQLRDLIAGIREARRERLLEFDVTADNLWIDGEGKLRFINYWTEVEPRRRDAKGLSGLLYQICTRRTDLPATLPMFYDALRPVMADLPGGTVEETVEWACSAFLPSCTLREYEKGLDRLLTEKPLVQPAIEPRPAKMKRIRVRPFETPPAVASQARVPVSIHLRPWHLIAVVVFAVCILGGWGLAKMGGSEGDEAADASVTVSPTATAKPAATTAAGVTASPSQRPQQPSASPSPSAAAKPAAAPAAEPGIVPDLNGRTRAEAEKLILQAGLKYQFFLEANPAPQGTVFKQDPPPGTKATKGDKITFYVSKGK